MSNTQLFLTILTVSSLVTMGTLLAGAIKENNKGKIKADLFFITLILASGITLIMLSRK